MAAVALEAYSMFVQPLVSRYPVLDFGPEDEQKLEMCHIVSTTGKRKTAALYQRCLRETFKRINLDIGIVY